MSPVPADRAYYENLARTYATQYGIDPDIFVAQINQESGFQTGLTSSGGAQGISQIIPRYHPGVDPWDPDASLNYAAQLISGHLNTYGGDIRKALTAYHAGPGILNRAMELGGGNWEGSIQAAAMEFFPSEAERIGRDNATYLSNILGGGALVPRDFGPAYTPLAAQTPRPLEFYRELNYQMRMRLIQIAEEVYGQPADKSNSSAFPWLSDLVKPFERESTFNQTRLDEIEQELAALYSSVPTVGSALEEGIGWPWVSETFDFLFPTGIPFGKLPGAGGEILKEQQEKFNERMEELKAEQDTLFGRYDDLARFFNAVSLQFDALQDKDPEVRTEAQSLLDQLIAENSPVQQQMMEPVLNIIREELEEAIEQLTGMTPEEIALISQQELTDKLFETRRARPIASYLLTTEQIRLSLTGFRAVGPEEELTGDALRALLMAQGLDSEEAQAYREDTLSRVRDKLAEYKELEQTIADLRTGQGDWSLPKPGTAVYLKAMVLQPLLITMSALEKYRRGVVMPLAGIALYAPALVVPGEQKIERDMDIALEEGNFWQAAGDAWEANTWHPVAKFAFETIADPTSYIGWGIATKLVKPLPILGRPLSRMVAAAEYGYLEMANAPFRLVGSGLRGIIKRPAATLGSLAGERTMGDLIKFVTRAHPGTDLSKITSEQVTESLSKALTRGYQFPDGIGLADLGVGISRTLRAQAVPDIDSVLTLVKRAGGTLTRVELERSKVVLLDVETRLIAALDDPQQTGLMAQQLMTILGIEDTADGKGFRLVKTMVDEYVKAGDTQAQRLIQGDTLDSIFTKISSFTEELTVHNHQSLAAVQALNQGRLSTAMMKSAEGLGAVWSGSVEKWMIRPLARSYLLFGMYHLWNVAETKGKLMLAGINPFYRGNRSQMIVNTWADAAGARTEVLLGGGRGLMWGETYQTVQQARKGMEKFLAPKALSKLFREELAVKIQAADQVLAIHQLSTRELMRLRPKEWEAIEAIKKSVGWDFKFLPRNLRPWAQDAGDAAIIHGPQSVKSLPGEATIEQLRAFEVQNMLAQYTELDSHVQDFVLAQAKSGRLFSHTEEVGQEVVDLVWDAHLRSPEFFAFNFEEMAEELLTAPINTWEDFSKRLMTLQGMSRGYGGVLKHQYGVAMEASEKVVLASENDAIWLTWGKSSNEFGTRASTSIDTYIKNLRSRVGATGERASDVELLMSKYQALADLQKTAYAERAGIAESIFGKNAPKGARPKTHEDWLKAKGRMAEPFKRIDITEGALTNEIYTLEARIGQQVKNPIPDVTGRTISRADIATIYGMRLDDVSAMTILPDLQAIMGKDEFTQEVVSRITLNLEPGQDIAKLGWTKESIGEVWDDIMREFRLNPENVSRIAPALIQVEDMVRGVRAEALGKDLLTETVTVAGTVRNVKGDMVVPGLRVSKVATEVGDTVDMAMASLPPEIQEVAASSVTSVGVADEVLDLKGAMGTFDHTTGALLISKRQLESSESVDTIIHELIHPFVTNMDDPQLVKDYIRIVMRDDPETMGKWLLAQGHYTYPNWDKLAEEEFTRALESFFAGKPIQGMFIEDISKDMADDIIRLFDERFTMAPLPSARRPTEAGRAFQSWADDLSSKLGKVEGYAAPLHAEGRFFNEPKGFVSVGGDKTLDPGGAVYNVDGIDIAITAEEAGAILIDIGRFAGDDAARFPRLRTFIRELAEANPTRNIEAVVTNPRINALLDKVGVRFEVGSGRVPSKFILHEGKPGITTSASWLEAKGEALETATTEFYRMFPDYVDLNYLDKFFRSQFPFWVYEWHRLWYLPRQFMRTPGLLTGIGRYNEATGGDNYIHIPFTSLEINPLRGTILMGGLRRLLIRDYPEFYDTFPKVQQALDSMGRFGFYPGAHVTIGNLLFGTGKGPQWGQLGEIVPVWMKAPIQGFQSFAELSGNETMIEASKRLANVFIPERFRNYMIAMKVSQIGAKDEDTGKMITGADLLNKMMAGNELDPFEQDLWDRATGEMSPTFLLLDQTGMFRFRPEELTEARTEYDIIVSEYTGFTIDQLRDMRNWGMRWQDIVPPSPEMRDLLSSTESLERWSGFTGVLFGASEQQFRARRNEFWDEVDVLRIDIESQQEELDCRFGFAGATQCTHPGSITARDWKKLHGELGASYGTGFENLRKLDRYKDIPVTHDEVIEFYQRTGQPLPTEHPMVELLRMYYDIQLEEVFDPETGQIGPDFDTFYMQREILLQAADDHRDELEDQIRKYESDLEKLHRWSYEQYLRPYYNRRDVTIERFPPEAQTIIRQWLASGNTLERDQLEAVQLDGRSVIRAYQDDIKRAGKNLRFYSPDLDAWLNFWQVADSFRTDEGQRRYEILMRQYRPGEYTTPEVDEPVMVTSSSGGGDD